MVAVSRVTTRPPTRDRDEAKVTVRCARGHLAHMPLVALQRRQMRDEPVVCLECGRTMGKVDLQGLPPAFSNKTLVSTPGPTPSQRSKEGVLCCATCLGGDHHRCVGVRCFCRADKRTRDAHMAAYDRARGG